ncbi:MAG: hypothetical protein KC619_26010 [Myxococcales bacterium]|nr:hypothetical protein [Myxococcales bacterium]
MTRHLLVALALVSLSACGSNDLTARGSVIASYGGTERGFDFVENTRLEAPEGGGVSGIVTGSCEMAAVGDGVYGIVVEIHGGNPAGDDFPLTSVTIMQRSDSLAETGSIEATIGESTFTSSAGCSLVVPYAEADSGMVGLAGDCTVMNDTGEEATLSIDLDLIGCTVLE